LTDLALTYGAPDVEITHRETVFNGYFRMDALTLRHRQFDGAWTDSIRRELFERGDAVAVLPWDIESDSVI
jgi:ADP-ribose pyrophosphatase